MVNRELEPAIRSKRRGNLSKEILLLHENARPHTAAHTSETPKQLKWEATEHPAYSPHLALSDFHVFGPLKEASRGRRFSCDDVKTAVHQWLFAQSKTFFLKALKSW
jgi:histone-lysine N-methyltransferase SETMAR